jgi:hypothetical protein
MAGHMLTAGSSLKCPHGGTVSIIPSKPSPAAGAAVATAADQFVVVGCPFQLPTTPPIPSPCVTVRWVVTDVRVKANGAATLSRSSQGLCYSAAQVPQGPVVIGNTQEKVSSQ